MGTWDEKVPGSDPGMPGASVGGGGVGAPNPAMLEFLKTLFAPPSAAPMGGGGQPSVQMPSRVVTGPPQVNNPSPGNPNTPPSSAGAASGMPAMPAGSAPQQAVPAYSGQMEFSTGAGKGGAITSSAIGSVFGAIHQMTEKKNQDNIQHAQFLYDMVKTASAAGDMQTVNAVLGDPKRRKMIEKYLTGELPRVPVQPGQKADANPKVNQPGGIALPQPSQASKNNAMVEDIKREKLESRDPAMLEALLPGSSLSPKDFKQAMRAQYGMELSPAQLQAMSEQSKMELQKSKSAVEQLLIEKYADYNKALALEGMKEKSQSRDVDAEIKGRSSNTAQLTASRERIAAAWRTTQEKIKSAKGDGMDLAVLKTNSDMYKTMAKELEVSANDEMKAGHREASDKLRAQAQDYVKRSENLGNDYVIKKQVQEDMKGIPVPGGDDGSSE
jgi:hypothetical protein